MRHKRGLSLTLMSLSSAILASYWTPASAQDIPPMGPTTPIAAPDGEAGDSDVPVGTVTQPTIAQPGWVLGIKLGELYTDNVTLGTAGRPQRSSWITQIQPFIKAAYDTPRFSGVVDYRLNGYVYAGQSRNNQLAQDLKTQGKFIVLPQHLFVDATAFYGSQVIDNQMASSSGTYFLSNNRANAARYSLSPYWLQDLGSVGTAQLRYSYGRVMYNTKGISAESGNALSGIPNITSNALQFVLVSPKERTFGWNAAYSEQRIEPDFGRSVTFALAKLGTYLEVSTTTRLLADAGKETKFLPDGTVNKLGASFWDAGFAWSNGQYRLKALIGHRFYGRSYEFSWSRTAALLTAAIDYKERPTDLNQRLLGENPGQAISSPIAFSGIPSLREQRVYLMKRATASANYQMPNGRLGVRVYDERRIFFTLGNAQQKVENANINWLFNLGARTSLTPSLGWQKYQFQGGQIRYNRYADLTLSRRLDRKNFGSLRLRHDSSNINSVLPEAGARDYRVNVVFLQWTHLF